MQIPDQQIDHLKTILTQFVESIDDAFGEYGDDQIDPQFRDAYDFAQQTLKAIGENNGQANLS